MAWWIGDVYTYIAGRRKPRVRVGEQRTALRVTVRNFLSNVYKNNATISAQEADETVFATISVVGIGNKISVSFFLFFLI